VPDDRIFDIGKERGYYTSFVYSYPFLEFAQLSFTAVNLGICRHFLDEASTLIAQHSADQIRFHFIQNLLERQKVLLADAASNFYEVVERSWQILLNDEVISDELLSEVSRASMNTVTVCLLTAQRIYPYLGLAVTMEHSEINRCWRDLHTASQHILLKSFE
jgi:alkylation response protein AidB-like acyl-CoA dehydrogenase